ncbi:MAG: tetratricopeptide (TPR) repeat protein [Verrucomicrobiales bacterium]
MLIRKGKGEAELDGSAEIDFTLTESEREELRWYLEDYLTQADTIEKIVPEQVESLMESKGVELYTKVLAAVPSTQAIWFAIREKLADLRVEITTPVTEAASIPWELMRDPQSDSAIALRVESFVRVQSNSNISFVTVPKLRKDRRVRLLYVVCRPSGVADVQLRAVANRVLKGLGENRTRFDITALRPPTWEQLQTELKDAKAEGRPYHIVHFDGHGVYADLSNTKLADWLAALSSLTLGGTPKGKHGYLLFEHPGSDEKMRPVHGSELGQLLHDNGVPCLVLNACQSAMHDATEAPAEPEPANAHDEVRAIGSLAQSVIGQGIPAVLGMRYSVYVVTAAQYIGELYANLAKGRGFGQAASEGRKHLAANPERWLGLEPRPLRDWFVPVVYEATPLQLLKPGAEPVEAPELDPIQLNPALLRYVPDSGFIGRDETLLLLDRAFDQAPIVLLHAYAGQGKTTTAVEFARWYAQTGGLGQKPIVLFTSFESTTLLNDVLDQLGQKRVPDWTAINEPEKKRQTIQQLLRKNAVLWIWDNVETVAGFPDGAESAWTTAEQAELADFLKLIKLDPATKAKFLLTSRRDESKWLGDPGVPHRVKMPRMRDADAVGLAFELGSEKKLSKGEIAGWQPLLDYCQGNPLTLRVLVGQAVKMGLRGADQIASFVQAIRDGETRIEDADEAQGRDRSLGASLDYGFRNAFSAEELPVIALLHLFQGVVDVDALKWMGEVGKYALPELRGRSKEELTGLLERAAETGLLTPLGGTWFQIHPALPWFLRQLFAEHFPDDASSGGFQPPSVTSEESGGRMPPLRSSATQAQRAWVEAIGTLGNLYHNQFNAGNREVIQFLELEESNLLHARRLCLRRIDEAEGQWWDLITSAMQGLNQLYEYQSRGAEWARLVAEITPHFCTGTDDAEDEDETDPFPGRESEYSLVMKYRVDLAQEQDRDLSRAAKLQEKCVAWNRKEAAEALALPEDAPLDDDQRHRIRNLGVGVFTLGHLLMEQGNPDCVAAFEESVRYCQRIGDQAAEAVAHYNLGHAWKNLPAIRDIDAAEAAYQQSLDLYDAGDRVGRCRCIFQIGRVHYERFDEDRAEASELANEDDADPSPETKTKLEMLNQQLLEHARAAESRYQEALELCPPTLLSDLGPIHNQLGILYKNVGQIERAREHYEKRVQIAEQSSDRYGAGRTRFNLALMYLQSAGASPDPGPNLQRARAYAEAALRDFKHFEGRAADMEAKAKGLIEDIDRKLAGSS